MSRRRRQQRKRARRSREAVARLVAFIDARNRMMLASAARAHETMARAYRQGATAWLRENFPGMGA